MGIARLFAAGVCPLVRGQGWRRAAKQRADGLEYEVKIMTYAAVTLVNQIQACLARHTGAGIDRIGFAGGCAARQQRRFVFVIGDRGQAGDAGARFQHLAVKLGKLFDILTQRRAMSPFRMLYSCGNSSSRRARSQAPVRVMRAVLSPPDTPVSG